MTKQQIVEQAQSDNAQHSQYDGYWAGDEWHLVRFTKRVTTKFGVAFEKGDVTIARAAQNRDEHDTFPTAYSLRNHINTSVKPNSFVAV